MTPGVADAKQQIETDERLVILLAQRLSTLARRLDAGEQPNPTVLLCLRNIPLSASLRLEYRWRWIQRLIEQRRVWERAEIVKLLETVYLLTVARQGSLNDASLASNRAAAETVTLRIRSLQPGYRRLSHYCSRRTAPDPELLSAEYFAQSLFRWVSGGCDYLSATRSSVRPRCDERRQDPPTGGRLDGSLRVMAAPMIFQHPSPSSGWEQVLTLQHHETDRRHLT